MPRRLTAFLTALCLVPLGASALQAASAEPAPRSEPVAKAAEPPKAGKERAYRAVIRQTKHGIPHISGRTFGDIGFGSGYMTVDAAACTLADTLITARGQRSLWFGTKERYDDQVELEASNLQVDAFVTDLRNRRVVEKLLADRKAGPGRQARAMVAGYVAGVNEYLATKQIKDPECRGAAFMDGIVKVKPIDLWYGVYLANLMACLL